MRNSLLALWLSCVSAASFAASPPDAPDVIRVAPIRTAEQLQAFLQQTGRTPLDALSSESKKRFIASLRFSDKGLSTYRFDDIERELTRQEAYALTSLFDVQESVAKLHFDK